MGKTTRRDFLKTSLATSTTFFYTPNRNAREEIKRHFQNIHKTSLEKALFGDLHYHTIRSGETLGCPIYGDKIKSPEEAREYAIETEKLDFGARTDKITPYLGNRVQDWIKEQSTCPEGYIEFAGAENANCVGLSGNTLIDYILEILNLPPMQKPLGTQEGYGHQVILFKEYEDAIKNPFSRIGFKSLTSEELWERISHLGPQFPGNIGKVMTTAHCMGMVGETNDIGKTGGRRDHRWDYSFLDKKYLKAWGIANKWGCDEGIGELPEEPIDGGRGIGNPLCFRPKTKKNWIEYGNPNARMSITGETDDHSIGPGSEKDSCGMPYSGTITAVFTRKTRNDIWNAIWNGQTNAVSTGEAPEERSRLLFSLETNDTHNMMGTSNTTLGSTMRIRILGAPQISKIEIIHDGEIIDEFPENHVDQTYKIDPTKRHFTYPRATIPKGHVWASPVYLGKPNPTFTNPEEQFGPYVTPFPYWQLIIDTLRDIFRR